EVGDEPLARVDHVCLARPGRHRPPLHALAQGTAADVDREGHDLAVVLLAQPGDGDRRVESAGVGEDDLLHRGTSESMAFDADRCSWLNRSSQRSRAGGSAKRTSRVLSPATVPTCSSSGDSSMAWAMTLAVPGEPVRTRIRPLRATRIGMSPRIRRRRSVEAAGAAPIAPDAEPPAAPAGPATSSGRT